MIVASFILFLAIFLGVGIASSFYAKHSRTDYYLAGRNVAPWLAALSAVATNNSGYMFIGVIGFTYASGLSAIWLMIGWIGGDFIGSLFIHTRLREITERTHEASYPAVIARWHENDTFAVWRRIAAVVMLIFLGAYAAAQISAGGKALQGTLGWHPDIGAFLVAAMILAYSTAGGLRASIWTDAAQSLVMVLAMALLFAVAVAGQGGFGASIAQMHAVPGFLDLFPDDLLFPGALGIGLFVVGWMFAGFSVVGQPHVMVRFMALDDPKNIARTRAWYYSYFTLFYALTTGVGLLSRLYLPDLGASDPELALPTMALELLPAALVGMILAGVFAATMSTADSLVLSCSAAITHDLLPARRESPLELKLATALVTVLALGIALGDSRSVFQLVILSWSALASAFAPLITIYALNRKVSEFAAVLAMIAGVGVAIVWRAAGYHDTVYEGFPGIITGLAIVLVSSAPATESKFTASDAPVARSAEP